MDESLAAWEEAYQLYLDAAGQPPGRLLRAFDTAYGFFLRGNEAVGRGWLSRAQRLLADEADCPEQGYLLYFAVETSLDGGEETMAKARQVQDFGRRHGDPNLVAAGIVAEGRVLIKLGRAHEGVALLDEGMLEASTQDLSPTWAGNIYCHLMAACYELGDIGRAAAWTQSTSDWCDRMAPAVLFKGICRVHRAQVMQIRGAWTQAQDEAERVCEDVAHIHVGVVAEGHYQIGEIKRLRGDLEGAEQAYEARSPARPRPRAGAGAPAPGPGPGRRAAVLIRSALAGVGDRLARARFLAAQVEIAVAGGDAATASSAADELDEVASVYGSSGLQAAARRSRGAVLLATGRTEEALSTLRTACSGWTELEAPYDCAKVRVLLARAYRQLGDIESSERELDGGPNRLRGAGGGARRRRSCRRERRAVAPERAHRAGSAGAGAGCGRLYQPPDRRRALPQPEDRGPARVEHLHEARGDDPYRGRTVRLRAQGRIADGVGSSTHPPPEG